MNDQLLIRAVIKEDFTRWKELWDGYNAFYGRSGETALADNTGFVVYHKLLDAGG